MPPSQPMRTDRPKPSPPRTMSSACLTARSLGDCYTWLKDTKREDPRKVFSVKDGMIHVSGDGLGGLVTNKRYRDYHLVLEFKFGDKTWHEREKSARDSGLLVHSNGKDGGYNGTWMPSIEVQIIEGGVGDFVPVPGSGLDGNPVPITLTCNVGRDRDDEVIWKADGPREVFKRGNLKRVNWFGRDPDWKDEINIRGPQDKDSPHGQVDAARRDLRRRPHRDVRQRHESQRGVRRFAERRPHSTAIRAGGDRLSPLGIVAARQRTEAGTGEVGELGNDIRR